MCILKYGSKFWATLPELELAISFQQATNALCLGKAVSLFSLLEWGILKWGFHLMKLLNKSEFRRESFVYLLLASELSQGCLASWPLPCFIRPILIHSLPPPSLFILFLMWFKVASSCSLGEIENLNLSWLFHSLANLWFFLCSRAVIRFAPPFEAISLQGLGLYLGWS